MNFIQFFFLILILNSTNAQSEIKIALTFDDGPAAATKDKESPTDMILNILETENISAAFFVLTGPDRWMGKTLPRGETLDGLNLIRKTIRNDHLVACHWGGTYIAQKKLHPNRLKAPAYDFNNDGVIDKVSLTGNALETDLLECISRVKYAWSLEGIYSRQVEFMRPPLWVFKNKHGDARSTYETLGLKMILTDAKLYDGGFGFQRLRTMLNDMKSAIKLGEKDIILTMHDPMMKTAKKLKKTIRRIRKKMKKLGLVEGSNWSFTKTRIELLNLFRRKTYFALNNITVK